MTKVIINKIRISSMYKKLLYIKKKLNKKIKSLKTICVYTCNNFCDTLCKSFKLIINKFHELLVINKHILTNNKIKELMLIIYKSLFCNLLERFKLYK